MLLNKLAILFELLHDLDDFNLFAGLLRLHEDPFRALQPGPQLWNVQATSLCQMSLKGEQTSQKFICARPLSQRGIGRIIVRNSISFYKNELT